MILTVVAASSSAQVARSHRKTQAQLKRAPANTKAAAPALDVENGFAHGGASA
ncbi:hypothetical protein [Pseudazoarcus pumilus]|uniref:hypothetical protein n=1 Tax=Pseudazoarcus pumilus TaxID=2067960 RepID=UPI0013DA3979|nr:hypothetical protein [Pseudazoarcus pumilus]